MPLTRDLLSTVDAFRDLDDADLARIEPHLVVERVARGADLVRQGEPSLALYIVVSGRFHVWRDGEHDPIAEIGPGSPIGEIGFFAGGPRTATVRAERDSIALKLSRQHFDNLAAHEPRLWSSIVAALAARLARTTAGQRVPRRSRPRTVCLLPATPGAVDRTFTASLVRALRTGHGPSGGGHGILPGGPPVSTARTGGRVLLLDATTAPGSGNALLGDDSETTWFNDIEARHDIVVFVADTEVSAWSQKAIRQADVVLCVAASDADPQPGDLERLAGRLHRRRNMWLILTRRGNGPPSNTPRFLAARPWIGQHHHLAEGSSADVARLVRFLSGRAIGFVACGGGAFSPAHIGVYEALCEAGIVIDAFGGTSGGAAMAAAFAAGRTADEIGAATEDIFVRRRAMRRWTLPRYSLLDHTVLETALKEHYTDIDIADLPLPFFAVSTNLTRHTTVVHRAGSLWEAIRASSAIPALLPPVITEAGDMLVDGCLVDNVPVAPMHALKLGPNIVVDFLVPQADRIEPRSGELPARSELAWRSLTRSGRSRLPTGPSPQSVLLRGLMLSSSDVRRRLAPDDLFIEVPMPAHASHLDWHLHDTLRRLARAFTRDLLAGLRREGHHLAAGDRGPCDSRD